MVKTGLRCLLPCASAAFTPMWLRLALVKCPGVCFVGASRENTACANAVARSRQTLAS
ncbi:hypothetical protein PC129_g2043 [Phytophthora cactorum]|uniref:Secreted protein n=1 Tax=Phytophthora cactorum TaxID=29920 RepID=A0A8T1IPQ2_9STRA|nr:hypothetical protein PC129_g2043 [Phytophthora cactorum]